MFANDTDTNYDYLTDNKEVLEKSEYVATIRALYMVTYLSMCVAGVVLNSYVIVAGFRMFQRHSPGAVWDQHTCAWVLTLAVTHLVFSAFLVLQFLYALRHFNWNAGEAMCKLSSFIFYFSMFSTATLLSLISVSKCIGNSKCLRSFCCTKRGTSMNILMVLSSWTFGAILSSPSLFSRVLRYSDLGQECIDDFNLNDKKTTGEGLGRLTAVVLSRFLLGILLPLFAMAISAYIANRQVSSSCNEKDTLKKVACLVKVAYIICWTPLLSMGIIQVKVGNLNRYGLPGATMLATAHCVINPVIYLLVGCKTNMAWMLGSQDKTQKCSEVKTEDCKYNAEKGTAILMQPDKPS